MAKTKAEPVAVPMPFTLVVPVVDPLPEKANFGGRPPVADKMQPILAALRTNPNVWHQIATGDQKTVAKKTTAFKKKYPDYAFAARTKVVDGKPTCYVYARFETDGEPPATAPLPAATTIQPPFVGE